MNATPAGQPRPRGHRVDPKYVPYLVPAIMAIAMSFTMSLVQTIARVGFSSNLPSAWLTSFAIGVAVQVPPRGRGPDILGSCFVLRVDATIPHRSEGMGIDAHATRGRRSQDQAAG